MWVTKGNKNHPLNKEWLVSDLYENYKNEDRYVKLFVTKHEVFGWLFIYWIIGLFECVRQKIQNIE